MPTAKRATRSQASSSRKPSTIRSRPGGQSHKPASAKSAASPVSPVTGLPTRQKVHLPIKGYGRYNSFQVVEMLYGKTPAELKQILAYEEQHQARRMIIDRIQDMLRRAGQK